MGVGSGFRKNEWFLGYEEFVYNFVFGHHKTGLVLGIILAFLSKGQFIEWEYFGGC